MQKFKVIYVKYLIIVHFLLTGGVEIWELIENYNTFVHIHSTVEHDDIISSLHLSCDNRRAVSCGYDKWFVHIHVV